MPSSWISYPGRPPPAYPIPSPADLLKGGGDSSHQQEHLQRSFEMSQSWEHHSFLNHHLTLCIDGNHPPNLQKSALQGIFTNHNWIWIVLLTKRILVKFFFRVQIHNLYIKLDKRLISRNVQTASVPPIKDPCSVQGHRATWTCCALLNVTRSQIVETFASGKTWEMKGKVNAKYTMSI